MAKKHKKNETSVQADSPHVLVTGGAGYIGSHTCKALAAAGFVPVAYDSLSNGDERSVKWGPLVVGDIRERDKIIAAIKRYKPVAVLHFAALIAAGESVRFPASFYENNVHGSLTLLQVCIENKIPHFIFSSSAAVYGIPESTPIKEDCPTLPINPYGESKLMVEWMLRAFHNAYGLEYIALRYFNAAGADMDGEVGSYQKEPTNLIPIIMDVLTDRKKSLDVYGSDYDTRDGTALRDYIHVNDLADAHVKALLFLQAGGESQCINLGTGRGHTVKEVIEAAENASGRKVPRKSKPRRAGDPPALLADKTRAARVLKWKPRHSTLENIVESAYRWASGMRR